MNLGARPVFPCSETRDRLIRGAHDLTHLHQVSRILAHQYRDAVGPWNRHLGVMRCTGHSDAA